MHMLNNKITPLCTNYTKKFDKIYSTKFYDEFIKCNMNKKIAYENNNYNKIIPNLKILINDKNFKFDLINGYTKLYYNNISLKKIIEYNAFYPENFYYVWEILNKFNIINNQMNKYLVIDDGITNNNSNTSQGHLEALMKYCEDNFRYEKNEYIRIPFNKSKINDQDKKFVSIYSNHKVYYFAKYDNDLYSKIHEYFKDNKFDFVIAASFELIKNLISLVTIKQNGNAVFYIDDFLNQSNDYIINMLSTLFECVYVYQPIIQDKLDTSCWLILKNYIGINDIMNIIQLIISNKYVTDNTNIKKIRYEYALKYNDELLNLYSNSLKVTCNINNLITIFEILNETLNENENDDENKNINNLIKWAKKNKLITKTIGSNQLLNNLDYNEYTSHNLNSNFNSTFTTLNDNDYYSIHNEKLHFIKRKLNEYKRLIDTKEQYVYNNYDKDIIDWNKLTNCIDLHKNLRRIVTWKCNAELINNTWLKFYEIIVHEKLVDHNMPKFKSFHLCETTGSFIFALNHYIKTQTNIKDFEWYAHCQSYDNDFIGKCDLFDMFHENWLINNNGIANIKHINVINNYINNQCLRDVNLITCDGSIKIPSNKFNEQESYLSYTIYIQIYTMLNVLPKGGNSIIKMFLPLAESMTISILYLLSGIFENIKLVKPTSSHPGSSEVYCICKNYYGFNSINKNLKDRLYKLYLNYNVDNSIFPLEMIDQPFIDSLIKISNSLSDKQIDSIKRSLYLRDIYYYDYDIQNELSVKKEEHTIKWIQENNIKHIKNSDKIIYFQKKVIR